MSFLQSLILGLTQAITEFLPISSDGHLNLVQHLFGLQPSLSLDIFFHAATFISVLFFFRNQISYFLKNLIYIIIGSIPAAIVGIFFKDSIESIAQYPAILPFFFILTSVFLLLTKVLKLRDEKLTLSKALIIGTFQALAILPGVSRSGSTIFSALLVGLSPLNAFNYSFSIFIPASLGAIALGVLDLDVLSLITFTNVVVFLVTAIVGFFSLSFLKRFLTGNKLWIFGVYTLFLALLSFFLI